MEEKDFVMDSSDNVVTCVRQRYSASCLFSFYRVFPSDRHFVVLNGELKTHGER